MNNRCAHIESLLPAFVENELGPDDVAGVRAHLESCDACRAALAMFTTLEESLLSRRSEVPPVERFLPAFAADHVGARAASPMLRAFRAMMSAPGVAIVLAMWVAMLTFHFRVPIGDTLSRSTPERLTGGIDRLADLLVTATNGDVWMLIGVFSVVAFAVVASMGAVTLRYIRH